MPLGRVLITIIQGVAWPFELISILVGGQKCAFTGFEKQIFEGSS